MAKSFNETAPLDAALNVIKNNAVELTVCSTQPTTYAEGHTTYKLAGVTIDTGDFTGPAAGDAGGRKLTVAQQATITITASGTAAHVALLDSDDTLLLVTTCTNQALVDNDANTVTVPAWDIEIDVDTIT